MRTPLAASVPKSASALRLGAALRQLGAPTRSPKPPNFRREPQRGDAVRSRDGVERSSKRAKNASQREKRQKRSQTADLFGVSGDKTARASPNRDVRQRRADLPPIRDAQRAPKVDLPENFAHRRLQTLKTAPRRFQRRAENRRRSVKSSIYANVVLPKQPHLPKMCKLSTKAQRRLRVKVSGRVIPSPVGPAIE